RARRQPHDCFASIAKVSCRYFSAIRIVNSKKRDCRMIARRYLSVALAWALCIQQSLLAMAGESKLAGLSDNVNVNVDNYGVPHIYADSWTDAARVLGYLHASERLWQMD